MNKKTIFDWFKEITTTKNSWNHFSEDEIKIFNSFLIHKIVSMTEAYIEVANIGQIIPYNDKEKTYKFYCELLPKKSLYSKYIKGSKKKINEDLLNYVSSFYECSHREAEDHISILGKEGITELLEKYGLEDKIIKKIIKDI